MAPLPDPPERLTLLNIRARRFQESNFQYEHEYPQEDPFYLSHLVRYQDNNCVHPLANLPTLPVVCHLALTAFEDMDHYAVV
jgi:hypothetical protein